MLIRRPFLDGIAAGRVTLAFRRWVRPTVRAGGTLRTAAGVVAIDAVDPVDEDAISEEDARRAGFGTRAELLAELAGRPRGRVYRIELRLAGPDPRVGLRERADLGEDEAAELGRRLARMDAASRRGPWTLALLRLIDDGEGVAAAGLAAAAGTPTARLKSDVRRLKDLGLTESLPTGYRLSPRGRALLGRLSARPGTGSDRG